MAITQNIEEKENILEIAPIGKGKRVLVFLADYFLSFFLTFLLFNVAITPLGYVISQYEERSEVSSTYENMKLDILYGRSLLYYHDESNKYKFSYSISYTYDLFLSYFCLNSNISPDVNYPEYGHKIENDVIWTYYHNIKSSDSSYETLFETYNTGGYFEKIGDQYVLKDSFKQELIPYFNPSSEISTNGKQYYDAIGQDFFFNLYGEVILDIEVNNLTHPGIELSFNDADVFVQGFEDFVKDFFSYSAIAAHCLSWLIYFFIIPFFRKKHQTIAMSIMKIQRLNIHHLRLYTKSESALSSIYPLLTSASVCFFLPMTIVGVAFPFSLSLLIYILVLSLLFIVISAIFMLFNSFNRTITDWLSQSVCVTTENVNAIYSVDDYNKKQ